MSSKLLKKDKEHKLLQAFLKPLWKNLHQGYVYGSRVKPNYNIGDAWDTITWIEIHCDGTITIRVIIIQWTGDGLA